MEKKSYNEQIDAFLGGELSSTEKQAFETALSEDAELQEAVRWHRLANKALAATAQDNYIRAVADGVRQRVGKLPKPKTELGVWQKLLQWLKTPLGIGAGLGLAAVLSVFVYANTLKSTTDLVSAYAFKPADSRVAGNNSAVPTLSNNIFLTELSAVYFNETPEKSLEKLIVLRGVAATKNDSLDRVLIDYYAAHAELMMGEYAPAQTLFESVLMQQSLLKMYSITSDMGKLRFNQIIAQLALNHDEKQALAALDALSKTAGTKREVQERCMSLTDVLSHPLRRFKVL